MGFNPYLESRKILTTLDESDKNYFKESQEIQLILEDADSPVTRKYQEKLYKSVIDKSHIDFGDIPKSAGNIRNYVGYPTMCQTLDVIEKLAEEEKVPMVLSYVNIVKTAIKNIVDLSSTYERGFTSKSEYVAMEYDTYVYFCVEATTALIYSFVEIVKSPSKQTTEMKIVNTKLRADEFYFEQLKKYNRVQSELGIDYRKMLESMCDKGRSNFGGIEALGLGAIIAAAMAIVPITREVVYQVYNFRGKLSSHLETQANFLELNKSCLEANQAMDAEKKAKVIKKQQKLADVLRKLSNDIRVKSAKSIADSQKEIKEDNTKLSVNDIKDEVSNSPFEIL